MDRFGLSAASFPIRCLSAPKTHGKCSYRLNIGVQQLTGVSSYEKISVQALLLRGHISNKKYCV